MATIIGYGSKNSHEFKLTVNEISTNIENNTSEVSFSFTIYKSSYSWSGWNTITYTININGTTYTGTIPSYSAGSTLTIRAGNQTIQHNDDGTKSINCSFSVNDPTGQSYTCGNANASDVLTLKTIARKSTINSFFGENIEDYFSVTYTSYYSKFTNKLRISIPNVKELEKFNYASGTTFKLKDETIQYLYNYMKKSKTILIGMVIETWNGNTKIGESVELTKTCYITDCNPQIESYSYLDTNSETVKITNNNQKIIRHMSSLRINLTKLTSYKGAELSKCTVTINNITKAFSNIGGTSIQSTYLDFGTLDILKDTNAVIMLTDTRGNTVTHELSISIYDYILLSINATIKRVQPTTGEVGIEFSGNYFNGSFGSIKNELNINWKYRENGQTDWIDGGNISPIISNNTFSNGNTQISLGKIFDYQKAYDFMLVVSDKLTTLQSTSSITEGIPIFNWGKDFVNFMKKVLLNGTDILEKTDGVVLYENEEGEKETVFLSETVENFNYIEIYFALSVSESTYYFSQKVYNLNEKVVGYSFNRPLATSGSDNPILQIFGGRLKLENTTITREMETFVIVNGSTGNVTNGSNETNIRIVKVIGYR